MTTNTSWVLGFFKERDARTFQIFHPQIYTISDNLEEIQELVEDILVEIPSSMLFYVLDVARYGERPAPEMFLEVGTEIEYEWDE